MLADIVQLLLACVGQSTVEQHWLHVIFSQDSLCLNPLVLNDVS